MTTTIETNGLNAAEKIWQTPGLKIKTLQSRVAYVHEQEKRHTGLDYKAYTSQKDYVDAMITAINRNYNNLMPYEQTLEKAAYRMWLLIQDPDGLLYVRTKFEDMYNNH